MAIAISAQMSSNLVALTSINSDMGTTQDRLSSGKKIASVLDGAGVFFRAQTLTAKAEDLNPVNANINAALSNVKVANKGIDTMYDNLNGLLTSLKDAKAKAIVAATAVNTATIATGATDQRTAYLTAASMIEASPTGTATAGNLADSTKFQTGDTFAISFTNSSGLTTTRHFYAGAAPPITAGTPPVTVPRTGVSQNLAMGFTDAAGLVSAFTAAFGSDDIGLSVDAAGKLALSAVNSATTITISQTSNVTPLNGVPSGTANAFLDFDKIFGASTTRTGGTGLTVNNGGTATTGVVGTQSTYTGTGNAATPANLETRRLASDTYKITLLQLANVAKDAYLPGFANLLTGNTMSIDLNEDAGDVVQNVSIGGAVDPSSLGFSGFNAQTGGDATTANNFGNDVDMTIAVNRVTAAMTTLRSRQNALANHTTMLSTRLEFNKSYQSTTSDLATSITSADMTAEAANMAALQNLQAFATNNLSVTKNAEASLIQLLR